MLDFQEPIPGMTPIQALKVIEDMRTILKNGMMGVEVEALEEVRMVLQ